MRDTGRMGRGRRRIAGQRRTTDRPTTPEFENLAEDGTASHEVTAAESTPTAADDAEVKTAEVEIRRAEVEATGVAAAEVEAEVRDAGIVDDDILDAEVADGEVLADGEADAKEADGVGRRIRLPQLLTAVLGVLLVITLVGGGMRGQKAWRGHQAEAARASATTAATKAAELILSYDYRTLDKDFGAARATLTPEYAADFDQTTKVVGEQAKKVKATVRAEVREVGVRDGDADRMTLLVFVNQTTTSTITQNKPRVDLNRARFTMVRMGDRWLVRSIDGL